MQNRFKFRCWDKINEKWMDYIQLDIDTGYITGFYNPEQGQKRRYILMQCTGLKDKNGKLIYEGDVVKSFHVSSTMQRRVFTGFVAYDDERCRYCILENKHCGYITFSDTDDVFEVIGNIYENKELLNERRFYNI